MDSEQEEVVLRITAQYVQEVQAGKNPTLSDYLTRYPQHAGEIADFIAYYHAVEMDVPEVTDPASAHAPIFPIAIDSAWQRVLQPEKIKTLLVTSKKQEVSLSQLARETGLSVDIVAMLEQRAIHASTIPPEAFRRLSKALQQPLSAVQAYFGLPARQQVAETPPEYDLEQPEETQLPSFRAVLEESQQLSAEQKHFWRTILAQEGL